MSSRRVRSQFKLRAIACGLASLAALCCVVVGCSQSTEVAPDEFISESVPPPDRVEITLVDRAEFDAVLAGLRGKVVLVDCWATWCLHCVEQLPHSVALAKEHAGAGLAVVTLDFDDPDAGETVVGMLEKSGAPAAHLTNLQSEFGGSTESMDAFEIAGGALPHYKLFNRAGQLRQTFEVDPAAAVQFSPADIEAAIEKLLAEH